MAKAGAKEAVKVAGILRTKATKSLILDFASKKYVYNADQRPADLTDKDQRRAFDSAPLAIIISLDSTIA